MDGCATSQIFMIPAKVDTIEYLFDGSELDIV
jgi:hypothetical protein